MNGLTAALLLFLATLLAGLLPRLLPAWRTGPLLIAVTGGILLATVLMVVLPEGFESYFQSGQSSPAPAGLALLAGFLLMLVLDPQEEGPPGAGARDPQGGDGERPQESPSPKMAEQLATNLVVGIGLHAFVEGIALGGAFASGDLPLALTLLLAVAFHKIPVAFSLGTLLLRPGVSQPLFLLFLFSLASPLGIVLVLPLAQSLSPPAVALALLLSGGTFLYAAVMELFLGSGEAPLRTRLLGTLLGAGAVLLFQGALGLT